MDSIEEKHFEFNQDSIKMEPITFGIVPFGHSKRTVANLIDLE